MLLSMCYLRRNVLAIEPVAGLSNRMRALDSAIGLSENINKNLHVLWNLNSDCNCKLDELFEIPKCIKSIKYITNKNRVDKLLSIIINKLYYDRCYYQNNMVALIELLNSTGQFNDCNSMYISTYDRFYDCKTPFKNFMPVQPLRKLITSYTSQFDDTIGIHIRRVDNLQSIRFSPTDQFIKYMNDEIQYNKNVKFFLSTDSLIEEQILKTMFNDRIIVHPKLSLDRNNPNAIKDALIDMYCLSKCTKIIGSYWSSFSETAAEISGIMLQVVKKI